MPMARNQPENQPKKKSVVFADNDQLCLEAVGEFLREKGFEVHLACDGLEALLAVRKLRPDYVILDIVMPKLDGARVCWLIRQDPSLRDTPVLAFSSLSPQDFRRFPSLSADAYVAKGPLATTTQHILDAIEYLDRKGHGKGQIEDGIFGYDQQRPRQVVGEMLDEKQRQANLFRAFGAGALELDSGGRILTANPWACQILGRKEQQLIGESLSSLCPKRDRKVVEELMAVLVKAASPEDVRTTVNLGEEVVALRLSSIVMDDECTGFLAVFEPTDPLPKVSD